MKTVILKLGRHRGAARLWIEGKQLEAAGFPVGESFAVEYRPGVVTLRAGDGPRVVSGRARKGSALPIVEVNAKELLEALGDVHSVRAVLGAGLVTVTPNVEAQS